MPPPRPSIERFARLMEARESYHDFHWRYADEGELLHLLRLAVNDAEGAIVYDHDWFKAACALADAGALAARLVDAVTPASQKPADEVAS